jgi:purine-nucleoside phosphorylase
MLTAAETIRAKTTSRPKVAIVLGSGLGAFADTLTGATRFPYADLPGLPASTAIGHAGELIIGNIGANGHAATPVAVMAGRFHLYEGYTPQQTVAGMHLFRELGIQRVVLTNASGGINPAYSPGTLVLLSDHINLQGVNPLVGPNDARLGPRFPDMTEVYSLRLRGLAMETADSLGITLHEGVYAGLLGPSYETPAEIRYLKVIGADLVGMSTVLEATAAHHMGIEILAISCVTNAAAGMGEGKLNHEEVLEVGRASSASFLKLLSTLLPRLSGL